MRKRTKAFLAFILMVSLIVSSLVIVQADVEGVPSLSMTVSATSVEVGDVVTVTVTNREAVLNGLSGGIRFDTSMFKCISVKASKLGFLCEDDPEDIYDDEITSTAVATVKSANGNGSVGVAYVTPSGVASQVYAGTVLVAKFEALQSGTTSFVLYEQSAADKVYKKDTNGDMILEYNTDDDMYYPVIEDVTTSSPYYSNNYINMDGSDEVEVTIAGAAVVPTSVSLDKESLDLKVGESSTALVATVLPVGADQSVTWSTSDNKVATVADGVVTAVKAGTATITATSTVNTELKATCAVTVSNVEPLSISVDKLNVVLEVGESDTVTATVLPSNAYDRSVNWTSEDSAVATVVDGVITGVKIGNTTVKAKSAVNDSLVAEVAVSVVATSVTGVSLNKGTTSIVIGDTEQLTATVAPSNATNKDVTWSSSQPAIANVDENGLVSANGVGEATITVETVDGKFTAECKVTVTPISVKSVTVTPATVDAEVGDTVELSAIVDPSNATYNTVNWTINDATGSIATVDSDGKVSCLAEGTVTVTATADGKSGSCVITITTPAVPVSSVTLNKSELTLCPGATDNSLSAEVLPAEATNKTVSWKSSDDNIAKVDSNGVVTGVANGSVTITATAGGKSDTCTVYVQHDLTHYDGYAATCTGKGQHEYWQCNSCLEKFKYADASEVFTGSVEIAPTGHKYTVDSWRWSDDGTQAWVTLSCEKEDSTLEEVAVTPVLDKEKSVDATCETGGKNVYNASYTYDEKVFTSTKEVQVLALGHINDPDKHVEMVDSTCTSEGNVEYYVCGRCNKKFQEEGMINEISNTVIAKKPHTMSHTAASAATCEGAGNDEYWYCSSCEYYYADENGNTKLDGIPTISPLGHDWKATWDWATDGKSATVELKCDRNSDHKVPATAASVTHDDQNSIPATCANAGVDIYNGVYVYDTENTFRDTYTVNLTALPHTKDDDSYHEAVPATCLAAGNVEYWECAECHQKFSDEAMTLPLTNVEIAKLDHTMTHTEYSAPTCEGTGTNEYWYCSNCETYYADEEGATLFTGDTTIAALGHNWQVSWGEWDWSVEGQLPTITATLICQNNNDHKVPFTAEDITVELDSEKCVDPTCTIEGKVAVKAYFTYDEVKYETTGDNNLGYAAHTSGSHVTAVDPTCEDDGNVEYWTCSVCQKTFSDEALTTEIANTVVEKLGHKWDEENPVIVKAATITERGEMYYICLNNENHHSDNIPIPALNENVYEGTGASWTKGSNESAVVVSEADYSKFDSSEYVGVYVDNMLVDKANYNSKSGSTQIIFKPEYLETLTTGAHNVMIVSNDGISNVTLTIEPKIEIVDNNGSTYDQNSDKGLPIESNVPVDSVIVDGVKLDPSNYTISDDGKTVTINKEYLDSLDGDKEYKIELVAENGSKIETTVKVTPKSDNKSTNGNADNKGGKDGSSPKTGDNGIAVLVIAMIASAGVFFVGKKKELF